MADKYTDDKLYKVVRKDGSHLNTKVNPDGTKSALQFTDDNNDLNGPVDLIEVDEEELIRTEYIQVPQNKRSLGELLVDEVFVPVIRDATTIALELCFTFTVCSLDSSFNLCNSLCVGLWDNQADTIFRSATVDGLRFPDVGIAPTCVRTSDNLHGICHFYIFTHCHIPP